MRASHSVMALGTSGTGETGGTNVYWELLMCFALGMTGGTNVYWKLLMCEALRMVLQIVMCFNPCYLIVLLPAYSITCITIRKNVMRRTAITFFPENTISHKRVYLTRGRIL